MTEHTLKKGIPWYKKTGWIIVLLIFFWPVGLILMWKYTNWSKKTKQIVSAVIAVYALFGLYITANPSPIITVDNMNNGRITTDEKEYTVTGTVGSVEGSRVEVNNEEALWQGDKFSATVKLKDGDNQVTIVATKGSQSDEEKFVIYKTPESELKLKREAAAKTKADAAAVAAKAEAERVAAEIAAKQPKTSFSDGTFLVGKDIQAGTYRNQTGYDSCYWERLSGTSGSFTEIIANDNPQGQAVVTILEGDNAFSSKRCGTWSRI